MDPALERILNTMKNKGISAANMERYLNIPQGSFSSWKRGMGKLYYSHIDKIADKLEVSIDYLIRGENKNRFDLSTQEFELIENFRKLSEEEKITVSANVKQLVVK